MKIRTLLVGLLAVNMLVLTACGGNGGDNAATDERTLNHFIQAIETEFDGERDAPLYQLVGATSGVMWHGIVGGFSASIYEFADIPAAEQAFSDFPMMDEQVWVRNGRFVLEANDDDLRQFFENIE